MKPQSLRYGDSTTLFNAVTSRTGLVTFYGASPRTFDGLLTKFFVGLTKDTASRWYAVRTSDTVRTTPCSPSASARCWMRRIKPLNLRKAG